MRVIDVINGIYAVGPLAQSVELCTYEVTLAYDMQGSRVRFSEGPLFNNTVAIVV